MKLKELLEQFTKDGVIDYDGAEKKFQGHIGGIKTTAESTSLEKGKTLGVNSVFESLGLEGVKDTEGLNSYVSKLKETSGVEKTTLADLTSKNETLQQEFDKLNKVNTDLVQSAILGKKNINEKYFNFAKTQANSFIEEGKAKSFEDAISLTAEQFPEWVKKDVDLGVGGTKQKTKLTEEESEEEAKWRKEAGL